MFKKLEIATNLAIIVVATLVAIVVVRDYMLSPRASRSDSEATVGTRISIADIDWSASNLTLVFALQTTCRYCTESAPFYRKLSRELQAQGIHAIAVLPESVDEGTEYLASMRVPVKAVYQMQLREIRVRGTPTLLLVNNEGVITRMFVGKVPEPKEQEVIEALTANGSGN